MRVRWYCPKCLIEVETRPHAMASHWCKAQAGKYLPLITVVAVRDPDPAA